MHNWHLLLLAFLAVLQPITSFSERNLVDGREQCCDRNSLLRDSRLSYGTFRFDKISADRRLSQAEVREDRRYEVSRDHTVLTRPSADRRLVEFRSEREARRISPEFAARTTRTEYRREVIVDQRRDIPNERESRIPDAHRISSRDINRDMRSRDVTRMRYSRDSDFRRQERIDREFSRERASRDNTYPRNFDSERRFRVSQDVRREIRGNGDNTESRRIREVRETKEIFQRARPDVARNDYVYSERQERRHVRGTVEERRARSESRFQHDSNKERRSLDRREREGTEERRSFLRSNSLNRIRDAREESRSQRNDVREERQYVRREIAERIDERRQQRDERRDSRDRMSVRRELRERSSDERRIVRESAGNYRNVRFERADTRRDSRVDERRFRSQSRIERVAPETRRVDTRRVAERDVSRIRNEVTERTEQRMMDRRDVRDSTRQVRSRDLDTRERDVPLSRAEFRISKNTERALNDERLRTNARFFVREHFASIREKTQSEEPAVMTWQYVLYTVQGIYLCSILIQMLSQKESDKKPRGLSWLAAPRSLVKVD